MENKIIIAGGRTFNNYELLEYEVDLFLDGLDYKNIEIVSGTAKGADTLGETYAQKYRIPIKKFKPDWSLGKMAGYLRNKQMAEYATHLIAFWDGESKGTKHMINLAKQYNLKIKIINY